MKKCTCCGVMTFRGALERGTWGKVWVCHDCKGGVLWRKINNARFDACWFAAWGALTVFLHWVVCFAAWWWWLGSARLDDFNKGAWYCTGACLIVFGVCWLRVWRLRGKAWLEKLRA